MEKMEYYYFTIPRSPRIQREWDSITNRVADLNSSYKYLYMDKPFYDSKAPNKVLLRFLFLTKADRKNTPIEEDISELRDMMLLRPAWSNTLMRLFWMPKERGKPNGFPLSR